MSAERQRAKTLGESGHLERAVALFDDLAKSEPASRAQTQLQEVEWLSKVGRCADARVLATALLATDDPMSKKAALDARTECDRIENPPTNEALDKMRARFRDATSLEKTDPGRAKIAYLESWAFAPTMAAMLGAARAAKASGDGVTERASLDRALAYAEVRTKEKAIVTASPRDSQVALREVESMYTDDAVALHGTSSTEVKATIGALVVRHDLASNTVVPIAGFPRPFAPIALWKDRVLLDEKTSTRLVRIGIDDEVTGVPLDQKLDSARFSDDGSLIAAALNGSVVIVDAQTGKTVATIPSAANFYGFTSDGKAIAAGDDDIRIFRAPSWTADPKPIPTGHRTTATVSGHYLATFGDDDSTFLVHDLDTRKDVGTLHGHFQSVNAFTLAPDGQTLISESSSRAVAWNIKTKKRTELPSPLYGPSSFTPDGTRIVTSWIGNFVELDAKTLVPRRGAFEHEVRHQTSFGPHGRVLFATARAGALRFDLDARKVVAFVTEGEGLSILPSPDDAWVAVVSETSLGVFDARGTPKTKTPAGSSTTLAKFDANALVAHDPDNEVRLDIATGKVTNKPLATPIADPAPPDTTPDGKVEVKANDLGMLVLKSAKGELTIELGSDFAIVTNASGASEIIGDEARVRCNVGWYWLPLEACRDRLIATDVLSRGLP